VSRTYILDTNVLLHDPKSLFVFEEHSVIIPIWVLEEIDRFKTDMNERGFNARTTGRYLDKLRERGSLKEGVKLNGGGTLRVAWDGYLDAASPPSVDNAIVKLAKELADAAQEGDEVILVSRDTNMRVKADAVGVKAENYRHDAVADADRLYTGAVELEVLSQDIDDFYEGFPLEFDLPTLFPHQFVHLTAGSQSALARWDGHRLVRLSNQEVWKVRPRNKEQAFALDLLVNPDIQLVTLMGVAGTGKTLVALAAGLAQVCDATLYRKLLVSRPVIPMGKDIGFLPGTMEEKLSPWMQPIFDNLDVLVTGNGKARGTKDKNYQYLLDSGTLQVEALTYIRGRSIPQQYLIIDEAQNLTPHEVKTIITRAGEGTKIVLTGDPAQIDNPYVDAKSNGLTYAVERFKDSYLAGHVTLLKGERSALAEEATKRL
jgi:PhoH-like ATPase